MDSADSRAQPRRSRLPWVVAITAGAVALVVSTLWAVTAVFHPVDEALGTDSYALVTVRDGEVGSSFQASVTAKWDRTPVGVNRAAGVVTSLDISAGDVVVQGDELYSVNLKPVVVGQGQVPAFRAIGEGAVGPDVAQLQSMLTALGFYRGPSDGKAEDGTVRAIKAWQKAQNTPQSGVVEAGDVVFVPSLPTRVILDEQLIRRGGSLAGGENVVLGLSAAPNFSLVLSDSQASLVPPETRVEISAPNGTTWAGYVQEQRTGSEAGTLTATLRGSENASLCTDQCGEVSVIGETLLKSRVVTAETVSGAVVPSAALITDAAGAAFVIDNLGTKRPVSVVAAARGLSVVEGLDRGLQVRLPPETP